MGDVFDAMNRAKQEQSSASGAPGNLPAMSPSTAEGQSVSPDTASRHETGGALPLPKVSPVANSASQSAGDSESPSNVFDAPELPAAPVAVAVERNREQIVTDRINPAIVNHQSPVTGAVGASPMPGASSLNGYSAEVVVHHDRGSIVTEQYRAIRTQVLARCKNRRLQVHVVTSAAPGEGKTISTLNLGMAFAEIRNQKTLLLEADLRRPTFASYFGHEYKLGLTDYLHGKTDDIDSIIEPSVYDNLQFMPAGEADPVKSTELLSSPRMVQLLDRLRDRYDFIFIDTPPVVTVTDPCILGAMADQTIMVVRLNKTASQVIDRAKRLLRASNCELAGVILTHLRPDLSRYAYRYTYGYNAK